MSKVYATCSYLGGSRELKQYGDYVELNSHMQTSACYSPDSDWSTCTGKQLLQMLDKMECT